MVINEENLVKLDSLLIDTKKLLYNNLAYY